MKYRPLGDFVKLSQGLAINSGTKHFVSEKKDEEFIYPLLRIADMMENTFAKYISKNVNPTVIANEDDIIYTRTGQIGLAFRGYKGVVHNNSFIVSLISDQLDKDYLFALLQSSFVREQALKLAKNSVQPDLTHDMFKSIMIPMPTMSVQKKIAKMYSDISDKIENNNKINAELESMAKTIYDYWFLQFEFPNEEGKTYKSSGGKMVWNEELKREIPEGWNTTTIGDITICHDSERIPLSGKDRESMIGDIPYYGATDIMGYVNRPIFDGDYVLLAEDGSVMDEGGHPILQRVTGQVWVNNHAHVLEPIKNHSCKLLMMFLKDVNVPMIKTGSIQMKINQENMNGITVPNIPEDIKDKINLELCTIERKQLQIIAENRELASLRDFLLPMLMNGQIGFK